jgi:hypothetical protein
VFAVVHLAAGARKVWCPKPVELSRQSNWLTREDGGESRGRVLTRGMILLLAGSQRRVAVRPRCPRRLPRATVDRSQLRRS